MNNKGFVLPFSLLILTLISSFIIFNVSINKANESRVKVLSEKEFEKVELLSKINEVEEDILLEGVYYYLEVKYSNNEIISKRFILK